MRTAVAVLAFLLLAIVGAGCDAMVVSPTNPLLPTTASSPTIAPVATAEPPAELEEWIAFRESFGLRADRGWVLQVADDPAATMDAGIPLLPWELDRLGAAIQSTGPIIEVLTRYGQRFPDSFAGVIVEGQTVILLMADHVDGHRAVLERVMRDPTRFDVREVRWSMKALTAFASTVEAERDWFDTVSVDLVQAYPNARGTVDVRILAPSDDVEPLVLSHFGAPPWMRVEWEGPPLWTGQRGTMIVTAIDENGDAVAGLRCLWIPLDPSVDADTALAYSTGDDGTCTNEFLPVAAYEIELWTDGNDLVATGRGTVPPDGIGRVRIVVLRP